MATKMTPEVAARIQSATDNTVPKGSFSSRASSELLKTLEKLNKK